MFTGSTPDAIRPWFDEMPGDHEVFGEMPGAHMMISGGVPVDGFQDAQAEGDEIEETIEVVDADIGKTVGKRKPWVGTTAGI
jgi:hypothetical protein